jgi:hypothetical protein
MTMKVYVTVSAPALEAMVQDMVASGRAGSNSEAVVLLLHETLSLRERYDGLVRGILDRITVAGAGDLVQDVAPPSPSPPPPDTGEERLSW